MATAQQYTDDVQAGIEARYNSVRTRIDEFDAVEYDDGELYVDIEGIRSAVESQVTPTRKNWTIGLLLVALMTSVPVAIVIGLIIRAASQIEPPASR